jgi:hypothetical protein
MRSTALLVALTTERPGRISSIEIREEALLFFDLRKIVEDDVKLDRVRDQVSWW